MDEQQQELAALDCWAAYSAAAAAIAGTFAVDNVPTERLRFIAATNTHDLIRFGAQIALHHRGADWRIERCGPANSEDGGGKSQMAATGQPVRGTAPQGGEDH